MWGPQITWLGDHIPLRLGASDLARHAQACPQEIAFKVRPKVFPQLGAWRKQYPKKDTFALGIVRSVLQAVHQDPGTATFEGLRDRLTQEFARRPHLHRAIKEFVATAVEGYLDLHEQIEAEIGPLQLILSNDEPRGYALGTNDRKLTAWALMYETADGCREVRRLRMSGEPGEENGTVWAAAAAKLAAGNPVPRRIRVLDVAVGDSTVTQLFDGSAEDATAFFADYINPIIPIITSGEVPVPGRGCGSCKLVGACSELPTIPGALGLEGRGIATRSVSASDVESYAKCPTRWLLERDQHLPKEISHTQGQARGLIVHQWLRAAHRRGVPCSIFDVPAPGGASLGFADGMITPDEYDVAYPYLTQHIAHCPLTISGHRDVVTEESVYCYDPDPDLVVVTKPDMRFSVGDVMVLWETKTFDGDLPEDEGEVFDHWFSVAWGLTVLGYGLAEHNGAALGEIRLEVLTPTGSAVYTFATDDLLFLELSRDEVHRRVRDWHTDDEWKALPGQQCEWCPVARWCPSRDV